MLRKISTLSHCTLRYVYCVYGRNLYLVYSSIKKVAVAASCLKSVLSKPSIVMLTKIYEEQRIDHLFGYLEPFKPTKRKKVMKDVFLRMVSLFVNPAQF